MIAVIRISGQVNLTERIKEALHRARLRRKYSLTLMELTPENVKLLKKIRNHIAYGNINKETLSLLIQKRSQPRDKSKKINTEKVVSELEKKNINELDIKPFFRLHPPRGGIETKKHFGVGKGVLGDNKEKINDLIRRML